MLFQTLASRGGKLHFMAKHTFLKLCNKFLSRLLVVLAPSTNAHSSFHLMHSVLKINTNVSIRLKMIFLLFHRFKFPKYSPFPAKMGQITLVDYYVYFWSEIQTISILKVKVARSWLHSLHCCKNDSF